MKYLISLLMLAACLNFNLTALNLTGQALAESLTGQAHADE